MSVTVKVEGLRELRAALGKADRNAPKALDRALKDAAQLVVNDAKRRIPLGPPAGGHVRSSVRSAKVSHGVEVRAGGARYPYYMWLEFGGRVGRRHATKRDRVKSGRYLRPAFLARQKRVNRACSRAVARALRAAGLRVRGGG